jgi:hypothetical protein
VSPRPKASQPRSAISARPAGSRPDNKFYVQTKGDYRGNFTRSDKLNEGKRAGKIYDGEVLVELTAEQAQSLWKIESHSRRKNYMLGLVKERVTDRDDNADDFYEDLYRQWDAKDEDSDLASMQERPTRKRWVA